MTSCRKIGEMNNNINNMPLYSMGVYMCLELPGHENSVPNTNSLDFSETRNNNIKNLSNTTILNSQNITKLVQPIYNSSNTTINLNISNSSSISYTSVPTTPSSTTPSPTTTTSPLPCLFTSTIAFANYTCICINICIYHNNYRKYHIIEQYQINISKWNLEFSTAFRFWKNSKNAIQG